MKSRPAKRVSLYINEGDQWKERPLYLELLDTLKRKGCAGGTVIRAVSGFTAEAIARTAGAGDAPHLLPLVVQWIDSEERVMKVLPRLREMVGRRLITLEDVAIIEPL